ncbi:GNAT family N-acetyltransferase [Arthrobacter pigmenti]
MLIRPETKADRPEILALIGAAFARADKPGEVPVEVSLQEQLFACSEFIPELSLVADDDALLIGSVITTRAWAGEVPVLGLGPIGVLPGRQNRGVGTALINATVDAAVKLGEKAVFLLGSTEYYPRFGFSPATGLGVEPPEAVWGDHFQALMLPASGSGTGVATGSGGGTGKQQRLSGTFRYAEPFSHL